MKPRPGTLVGLTLAAVMCAAAAPAIFRAGYSPDEEFTLFAVRGIQAHGLPLLPSGLLYDRGLLYSYVSWLAERLTRAELPAFRLLSLLSAAGALALGYALIRRLVSPAAATVAALLVATSLPFWAVATTGRFYAPFLLTSVGVVALVARRPESDGATLRFGVVCGLAAMTCVSRLTHELAFTLMAIPAAGLLGSWNEGRGRSVHLRLVLAAATGLAAAQALLMALHFVAPGSGGSTMIQRFFVWQVLNLFERPQGAPLGLIGIALVIACLLVPSRAATSLLVSLSVAGVVLAFAAVLAIASGSPLPLYDAAAGSMAYPLDMFWSLWGSNPIMVGAALALLSARLCGAGGAWPAAERAAHVGWIGWVLWFGVIESGITINYVLLPTVCMLAAIGVDLVAIGRHAGARWPRPASRVAQALLAGIAVLIVADQWSGTGSIPQRLAAARPTIAVEGIDQIRAHLQPADRVACTDELACLLLVGRVDRWLALDDYVRERFLVTRGGRAVGVYAGTPAVFTPAALFATAGDGLPPARVLIVDVFKEYPVGNSRSWLPRALEAGSLAARDLVVTPQARVVELEPGSRN